MAKANWDYLDWLLENGAADLSEIIAVCENYRKDHNLNDLLSDYLYQASNYRSENNLPQPHWILR